MLMIYQSNAYLFVRSYVRFIETSSAAGLLSDGSIVASDAHSCC